MTTKTAKAAKYSAWGVKNLCILLENLAGGLGTRREHCLGYVFVFENTQKVAATLLGGSTKGTVGA